MKRVECPQCGGVVLVIDKRAWCITRYAKGGCGSFWARWYG